MDGGKCEEVGPGLKSPAFMIGSIQDDAASEAASPKGKAPMRRPKKFSSDSDDCFEESGEGESEGYHEDSEESDSENKTKKRKGTAKAPPKKAAPKKDVPKKAALKKVVPKKETTKIIVEAKKELPTAEVRKTVKRHSSLGGVNLPSGGQPPIRMGLSRNYRPTKPISPVKIPPRE